MNNNDHGILALFAGVGGIEFGFKQAGFDTVLANELDPYAVKTYKANHKHPIFHGSITDLTLEKISEFVDPARITVITGGFPCQPFSVAGYRKGFEDDRGNLFWQIHRLIREIEPEVVFLENVKNLQGHDEGRTYETIRGALSGNIPDPQGNYIPKGYSVDQNVFNASDFGIPQNRERIFIVAFRDKIAFSKFEWPEGRSASRELKPLAGFIDLTGAKQSKYHYESNKIFERLDTAMKRNDTFYQWRRHYVRENKSGLCPTLTANMGMGGHNVPLIRTENGIRKLTPRECFNLMGMPELYLPPGLSDSRLYKQAGNAVVVPVVAAIAHEIAKALSAR